MLFSDGALAVMGQIEDDSTGWGEVKFIDPPKRTGGEGGRQQLVLRSRTKVGVVKTIRYRCNPNCKLCGPIGGFDNLSGSPVTRNLKVLRSGGSTCASTKLKRIDGKTPPGVDYAV